jgi:hypothetical protein
MKGTFAGDAQRRSFQARRRESRLRFIIAADFDRA